MEIKVTLTSVFFPHTFAYHSGSVHEHMCSVHTLQVIRVQMMQQVEMLHVEHAGMLFSRHVHY